MKWGALVGGAVLLVLASWFFRWEAIPVMRADGPASAYIMNRWTGEIRFLRTDEWSPVKKDAP
jgi:hypothetical protein